MWTQLKRIERLSVEDKEESAGLRRVRERGRVRAEARAVMRWVRERCPPQLVGGMKQAMAEVLKEVRKEGVAELNKKKVQRR